ncbi:protein translocase SEC61 complex subunit gamma [archaeon]|nr:protein translocase SEC61 complex subunit gamma [archaeon]
MINFNLKEKLGSFIDSSKRIFIVSKKPDKKEFSAMAKITGLGIAAIGILGYIITLIFALIPK